MKKSLILELHVPLSGDMFTDADKISALKHVSTTVINEAGTAFGEGNYTLTTRTKTSVPGRGPKKTEGVSEPAPAAGSAADTDLSWKHQEPVAEQAETAPPPHLHMAAK